jgi:hypothetical protein
MPFDGSQNEVRDVLIKGLRRVKRARCRGVISKVRGDGVVAFCMLGSILCDDAGELHRRSPAMTDAMEILMTACPEYICRFNNDPNTTEDDVYAVYERALADIGK